MLVQHPSPSIEAYCRMELDSSQPSSQLTTTTTKLFLWCVAIACVRTQSCLCRALPRDADYSSCTCMLAWLLSSNFNDLHASPGESTATSSSNSSRVQSKYSHRVLSLTFMHNLRSCSNTKTTPSFENLGLPGFWEPRNSWLAAQTCCCAGETQNRR